MMKPSGGTGLMPALRAGRQALSEGSKQPEGLDLLSPEIYLWAGRQMQVTEINFESALSPGKSAQ
jgi:hypothetical protein